MIREIFVEMELREQYPWKEVKVTWHPAWGPGTRVRKHYSVRSLAGVVVQDVIAKAVDKAFGFGTFVIIAGNGGSYSYENQTAAVADGWLLDWWPR